MLYKKLSEITSIDIEALIENEIAESQTIDFKTTYSLWGDDGKWKFLADISAFANSQWGDIIFGIREDGGIAKEITPLVWLNFDEEKRKIEQLVMMGLEPRVIIQIQEVSVEWGYVLIVRILKSHLSPHRVIFTGYNKTQNEFYWRNSAWNFQMNVVQLREQFLISDKVGEKIENFINKRIIEIQTGTLPVSVDIAQNRGKILLHIIPFDSLSWRNEVVSPLRAREILRRNSQCLAPLWYSSWWNDTINYEGYMLYYSSEFSNENNLAYTQIYRNGIMEWLNTYIIAERMDNSQPIRRIPTKWFEEEMMESIKQYLQFLKILDIQTPVYIGLTLLDVKWCSLGVPAGRISTRSTTIEKDILQLWSFVLEDYESSYLPDLRHLFDRLWQTCGYLGSMYFNEKWDWVG